MVEPAWGVTLLPDLAVARVVEIARHAEQLGYARCWVYDEGLATRELYVTLTAIGLATERLAVGPGVTNPYTRHPSVTAAAIASLSELTGGRAFVGFGAGGSLTLDPIGVSRSRPNARVRDAVRVCRALFTGKPVDYEGDGVRLDRAQLSYGNPSIPIWVAGRGPRVLASGAELADGVSLDHIHEDFLADQVAHVRRCAADAGNDIQLAYSATIVTTDAELERVRRHMTFRLVDSPPEVKERLGLGEADTQAIRAAMADGLGVAARLVRDEWVFPFVVHGTARECAARIADLSSRHGFSEFIVPVPELELADEALSTAAEVAGLVVEAGD